MRRRAFGIDPQRVSFSVSAICGYDAVVVELLLKGYGIHKERE
jgi:hypothetical protein